MSGREDNPGIVPRLTLELFERVEAEKKRCPEKKVLITCSYFEIYNEILYDLLVPNRDKSRQKGLEIKEHAVLGIYVQGLQDIVVENHLKVAKLMEQGNLTRSTAATNMNEHSSRSHSVFAMKIRQKEDKEGGRSLFANINLVDLAGSERQSKTGATGDRLREASNINKSLSALGNVINALADNSGGAPGAKKGAQFVPYRNSKLTRVLQDSLGGNSVTVMLAAISPASYNYDETLSTLRFADRAKCIKLIPKANEEASLVAQLNREIENLRKALSGQGGGGNLTDKEKESIELKYGQHATCLMLHAAHSFGAQRTTTRAAATAGTPPHVGTSSSSVRWSRCGSRRGTRRSGFRSSSRSSGRRWRRSLVRRSSGSRSRSRSRSGRSSWRATTRRCCWRRCGRRTRALRRR